MTENGRYICPECENYVDVDNWFPVDPVKQPDGDSCGPEEVEGGRGDHEARRRGDAVIG